MPLTSAPPSSSIRSPKKEARIVEMMDREKWANRRLKLLLTIAFREPEKLPKEKRFLKAPLLLAYFDACDNEAYDSPELAVERASHGLAAAEKTENPHLVHRANGLLASAYRVQSDYNTAQTLLDETIAQSDSCPCCLSDIYRRKGILAQYMSLDDDAMRHYNTAIDHYKACDDPDGVGRTLIARGLLHAQVRMIEKALEDEKEGFRLLSPNTPGIYRFAAVLNTAVALTYGNEEHFSKALPYLERFRVALMGLDGLTTVRIHLRWLTGLVLVRQDENRKKALRMLKDARQALVKIRHDAEVIAISTDIGRLYCDTLKYKLILELLSDTLSLPGQLWGTRPLIEKAAHLARRELPGIPACLVKARNMICICMPSLIAPFRLRNLPKDAVLVA